MDPFNDRTCDTDDEDSDQFHSDIESGLYAQIYHTEGRETGLKKKAISPSQTVSSKTQSNRSATIEYVTISSDSDSEPSKTELICRKRKRPASSYTRTSFSSDSSDCDVIFVPNDKFHASDLTVWSIRSSVRETQEQSVSSNNTTDSQSGKRTKTLTGFLSKCHPSYAPTVTSPKGKKRRLREETSATSQSSDSRAVTGKVGKVSVQLLNSLPGNNNRFKRIRLDAGEDPDLWRMDSADCEPQQKQRYYAGRKLVKCLNCKSFTDHVVSKCPFPRQKTCCSVCGLSGHLGNHCKRVICGKCFKTGHISTSCPVPAEKVTCSECHYSGHSYNDCPNHWRKFCNTTASDAVPQPVGPRNKRVSCSVCCSNRHFAFECPELRSDMYPRCSPFLTRHQASSQKRNSPKIRGRARDQLMASSGSASGTSATSSASATATSGSFRYFEPSASSFEGLRASAAPFSGFRAGPFQFTSLPSDRPVGGGGHAPQSGVANERNSKQTGKHRKKRPKKRFPKKGPQNSGGRNCRWKENLYTCPDGEKRTWKQIWTEPTASSSTRNGRIVAPCSPTPAQLLTLGLSVKKEFEPPIL